MQSINPSVKGKLEYFYEIEIPEVREFKLNEERIKMTDKRIQAKFKTARNTKIFERKGSKSVEKPLFKKK